MPGPRRLVKAASGEAPAAMRIECSQATEADCRERFGVELEVDL